MDEHRDPHTDHIDSIRDWFEFLEVLDAWDNTTSRYWDIEHAPELFSNSGKYSWWGTILAQWILDKSNVSPDPLLKLTRMIQAKDPLGEMTLFESSPLEIDRLRHEWRPYRQILIGLAEREIKGPQSYGDNEARDRWLYGKRQNEKLTWMAIHREFKQCRAENKWQSVDMNGIRTAVARYAEAFSLPLTRGTGGRPKTAK